MCGSNSSGSGCGGCSSGDSTGGGYTSTELHAMSLLQRQLAAASPSGGSAGGVDIGDSVAARPGSTAASWREAADSWQQHLRTGFASALPVSGDAAKLQHRKLPLQPDGSEDTGSEHPATCTVPGCRQCQYEHWRKRQSQLRELGLNSEIS